MSANNKQPFIESSPEEKDKMSGTTPKKYNFVAGAFEVVVKGPFNILFLAIPVAFICQGVNAPAGATFIFSLVGIAPLAERLGYITEQLAMHTNDTIGGLLNVTFGNATELIVAATALFRGFYRVVQLTLIGSVLSNLLLVLGSAFLVGGIKFEMQYFGRLSAENNTPLLLVTAMSLIFPTALSTSGSISTTGLLSVSRCASLVMLILYVLFLYFQLKTHAHLFHQEEAARLSAGTSRREEVRNPILPNPGALNHDLSSPTNDIEAPVISKERTNTTVDSINGDQPGTPPDVEEEDEEVDLLGIHNSLLWLAVITVLISFLSDALVDTIKEAADSTNISNVFLSAIVIPIIGNAAEHTSAIIFGYKNRLNLSLGIAVGSGTQIALFLMPLLVIIGWMFNKPMSLNFDPYEGTCLLLAVIITGFILKNGRSSWLDGAILIGAYIIICGGFWTQPSESDL